MKGDIVTFKPIALLLCASYCLTGCLTPFSSLQTDNPALSHCHAVAHYIANQYATLPDTALPVRYDNNAANSGFITIDEPSIYDVTFQHKGFDAVIEICLARHNKT